MSSIRFPAEGKPFLDLCRRRSDNEVAGVANPPFDTYADLLVFAAAAGFHHNHGKAPNTKQLRFLEQPNPMDFGLFTNDRRYPVLLLIALASSRNKEIVRDEELICRLTESFAAIGFAAMSAHKATEPALPMELSIASMVASISHKDKIQL